LRSYHPPRSDTLRMPGVSDRRATYAGGRWVFFHS
jgi:hypothetical protein